MTGVQTCALPIFSTGNDVIFAGEGLDTLSIDPDFEIEDIILQGNGDLVFTFTIDDSGDPLNGEYTIDELTAVHSVTIVNHVAAPLHRISFDDDGAVRTILMASNLQAANAEDTGYAGTIGDDVIIAGDGDDIITGNAGADTISGGGGDDEIIYDSADVSVDGGSGTDTLHIAGAGVHLDLPQINASAHYGLFSGIEKIDLTGTGDNSLRLSTTDLLHLTDGATSPLGTANTLIVDGNAGDAVDAGIGWTRSEEHTSELQSQAYLVCRLLLEKKK